MSQKIKKYLEFSCLFFKIYFVMIASMMGVRFYFIYRNFEYIKEKIPFTTYVEGLYVGWIFDNSTISYMLIFIVLLFSIYFLFDFLGLNKIGKIIWLTPLIIFQFILYTVSILDVQYFNEFGFHMNSSISDYKENNKEIISTFFDPQYNPFTNIVLIILVIIVNIYLVMLFVEKYEKNKIYSTSVHIVNTLSGILLIGLFVIGGRGGVGSVVLSWGRAYYSQLEFANNMTLNGAYNLGKSYYYKIRRDQNKVEKHYNFQEATNIVKKSIGGNNDIFLNKKNPLLREVSLAETEKKYNVVLVILESWLSYGIKSIGGEKDLTTNFDKIAKEGILFNNFYANGGRSSRGISSIHVSYPSPLDEAVTKDVLYSQDNFLSLGVILKDRGYSTSFVYGGDAHFDNMHGFLMKNGIKNIIDVKSFEKKDKTIKWGVPDDKMFDFGLEYLENQKEPFMVNFYTLSNHSPYDNDPNYKFSKTRKNDDMYLKDRAYSFSDYALGRFLDEVKTKKYANNTIFVFAADHGTILKQFKTNDFRFYHTPLLFWSPNKELIKPAIIDKVGSQVDIVPTLMNFLGGKYLSASWGQNLMIENKSNYAVVSSGDSYGVIDKDNFYYESKLEGKKLINKKTLQEINDKELKENYMKLLNSHVDLMFYQREQGIFGNK